jgi:hypothetical protein
LTIAEAPALSGAGKDLCIAIGTAPVSRRDGRRLVVIVMIAVAALSSGVPAIEAGDTLHLREDEDGRITVIA